ncbi:MAG: ribosomal-processing cysteine protease Prp [Acutalibacteraceae bacterium]|jgi:uncharacterized protein YsxB (DUF464 family)
MTRVTLRQTDGLLTGFEIRGHSGAGAAGEDVVCAAISSAAYMAANTVTEICRCPARAETADGEMTLAVDPADAPRCQEILRGFRLHMEQLAKQYPHHIHLISEV